MFTSKTVFVGIAAVFVLYVGMWVFKGISQISGNRTSGPGVLVANLSGVLTSPVFWCTAVLIFFAAVLLTARLTVWRHS
jgi:hypothetical protein